MSARVMRGGHERGSTLMEIAVTLALAAVVVALVGSLFVFSLQAWRRGQDLREAQLQASTLVDVVARDVRNASQAPSVTLHPKLELDEGEPILAISGTAASTGGAPPEVPEGQTWVVYVFRPVREDVLRQIVASSSTGQLTARSSRIVATGVTRINADAVANGVTVVVEVKRGRALAQARATAAPRNP